MALARDQEVFRQETVEDSVLLHSDVSLISSRPDSFMLHLSPIHQHLSETRQGLILNSYGGGGSQSEGNLPRTRLLRHMWGVL